MAAEQVQRRLAAIMAADVVGYSRVMEADEEGTLASLKKLRHEGFDPAVARHNGRIVKTTGDGALVEFASSVDALRCAVELQRGLGAPGERDHGRQPLLLRIGINIGDVIIDGADIYGNGVNVAARLEALAEPGGICISGRVLDQVERNVDAGYAYLGPQTVKNIDREINAYKVLLDPRDSGKLVRAPARQSRGRRSARLWVLAGLIALVAAGAAFWSYERGPVIETARAERMAYPLPDRPSIAVLPFTNISGDPAQQYFADGITEDLITDLSKVSGLFVIARNSVFAYRDKPVTIAEVAEELGIRYVLQGSVQRADEQVRINAQLIDATTGTNLWAERYDGALGNVFGLQDHVTRQIVGVLAVQLTEGETANLKRTETTDTDAYDAFLQGWEQYLRQTPESLEAAIAHFERAAELDPDYSRAYAALAAAWWQIARRFWHGRFGYRSVHGARAKAEALLVRAQRRPTALSHQVATAMLSQQGRHTEALAEGGKAIGIDPNDADSHVALAGALSLAGNPAKAIQLVRKAMRLNPHYPPHYLYELGLAKFGIGSFDGAADALERATELNPEDRWSYRLLLATYGHLGRTADAERILDVTSRNWRGYDPLTISAVAYWYPFKERADRDRLATGLRLANVPE